MWSALKGNRCSDETYILWNNTLVENNAVTKLAELKTIDIVLERIVLIAYLSILVLADTKYWNI